MFFGLAVAALLALPPTYATFESSNTEAHDYAPVAKRLPSTWHQADDHPVHALFKRQSIDDGVTYATVGSQQWYNAYPSGHPDTSKLPQEWINALNAAVAAGKIPNIPPSHNAPNQNPTYPDGLDPTSSKVCSGTYKCRITGDIWDAPEGNIGCGFGEIDFS
jgi:chitin deacetylase